MKRYIRSSHDLDNLKLRANELFTALKPYGAVRQTVNTDVYSITFNNGLNDSDPLLVSHCIESEGFTEIACYGDVPEITDYIDNETGYVCAKLIVDEEGIRVEVSEEV